MPEPQQETANQDRLPFGAKWASFFSQREEQVFLLLTLVIGAIVGAAVVAFILLTQRFGARIYAGHEGASWPRFVIPVAGSLAMGYLLFKRRLLFTLAKAASRSAPFSGNSSALRQLLLAAFPLAAKVLPFKSELELPPCWVGNSVCARKKSKR